MAQPTTLSERLAAALKAANLRQVDLVARTGLDAGYVSQLLSGKKKMPSRGAITNLARALDVSIEWLATGKAEMKPAPASGAIALRRGLQGEIDELVEKIRAELLEALPAAPPKRRRELIEHLERQAAYLADAARAPDRREAPESASFREEQTKAAPVKRGPG